jgi:hypothetical protein
VINLTKPGNEQEIQRNPSTVNGTTIEAISSNIDDKTMHETYLWPFANAVRAGTASIMCSYNRINGSYGTFYKSPYQFSSIAQQSANVYAQAARTAKL